MPFIANPGHSIREVPHEPVGRHRGLDPTARLSTVRRRGTTTSCFSPASARAPAVNSSTTSSRRHDHKVDASRAPASASKIGAGHPTKARTTTPLAPTIRAAAAPVLLQETEWHDSIGGCSLVQSTAASRGREKRNFKSSAAVTARHFLVRSKGSIRSVANEPAKHRRQRGTGLCVLHSDDRSCVCRGRQVH